MLAFFIMHKISQETKRTLRLISGNFPNKPFHLSSLAISKRQLSLISRNNQPQSAVRGWTTMANGTHPPQSVGSILGGGLPLTQFPAAPRHWSKLILIKVNGLIHCFSNLLRMVVQIEYRPSTLHIGRYLYMHFVDVTKSCANSYVY